MRLVKWDYSFSTGNVMDAPFQPVQVKIPLSLTMLATAVIIFLWRSAVPDVLETFSGLNIIYLLLVLSLSVQVTIIGWNEASMTFPVERE